MKRVLLVTMPLALVACSDMSLSQAEATQLQKYGQAQQGRSASREEVLAMALDMGCVIHSPRQRMIAES